MIRPELVVSVNNLDICIFIRDAGFWRHLAKIEVPYSFEEFKLWFDMSNQPVTRLCFDIGSIKFYVSRSRFDSDYFPEKEAIDCAFKGHLGCAQLIVAKRRKQLPCYYNSNPNEDIFNDFESNNSSE